MDLKKQLFIPTHRHLDGGLYRQLAGGHAKMSLEGEWEPCIIYENEEGRVFITTPQRWSLRFIALTKELDVMREAITDLSMALGNPAVCADGSKGETVESELVRFAARRLRELETT